MIKLNDLENQIKIMVAMKMSKTYEEWSDRLHNAIDDGLDEARNRSIGMGWDEA